MLATRRIDMLITAQGAQATAEDLVAALPGQAWRRISAGTGARA